MSDIDERDDDSNRSGKMTNVVRVLGTSLDGEPCVRKAVVKNLLAVPHKRRSGDELLDKLKQEIAPYSRGLREGERFRQSFDDGEDERVATEFERRCSFDVGTDVDDLAPHGGDEELLDMLLGVVVSR